LPREERANVGATSKNSLIFSPASDDFANDSDSVFLSFDLDEMEKDSFEFSDNIFSVSVGKPIVTPTGVKNFDSSENDGAMKTTLEDKVTQLVTNSERTTDFNLWDNYLSSQGEEDVEEDLKELISQNVGEHSSDEVVEEPSADEEQATEEPSEEITEEELNEDKPEQEENEEEIKWDWGEELKEELGAEDEPEEIEEEANKPVEDEEKIDDETSELFEPVDDEAEEAADEDATEEEAQPEETSDEVEAEPENEEDAVEEEEEDELGEDFDNARETVEYSPGDLPPEPEEKKKKGFAIPKFGKMFWILLGAFLIIGIAGAYFLFFTGGEKSEEQKAATEQKEEIPPEEYRKRLKPEDAGVAAAETDAHGNENSVEENMYETTSDEQTDETIHGKAEEPEHKTEEVKSETKHDEKPVETKHETTPTKHEQKVEEKPKQKEEKTVQQSNSLYKKFPGEKQISNLIFKHGGTYSVQISSWKDRNKAESEAKRLRNMGYDAFIVEKYLSALRSNWYLVRIGFFHSPEEAKQFRTKNKF
jgi:cell division septation protein DedD